MYLRLLSKAPSPGRIRACKILLIMKLTTILMLATCLQLAARGYAQKITLSQSNVSLKAVFRAIERQSDYQFFYKDKLLREAKAVSIKVSNASIEEVLAICLSDQPLSYSLVDKIIVIKKHTPVITRQEELKPPPPALLPVTGTIVSDSTGQPLSGVSVKLKGTSTGTYTDATGVFNLQIPEGGGTLVISSIGFETQEIRATAANANIRVRLKVSATKLNEIVIVGYTTQEKRKLTSAVVTVSGEDMNRRVATDPTALLQGQLPGLSVVQNSGEPGNETMKLRVRGLTTFSPAGTDPLYIIDGIPGNLAALNPNDIESISVLKDAASAAIYGSRGANGVIVVKTRKGKNGGFGLSYNYNVGIAKPTRLPKLITNSAEYMELANEAYKNSTGDIIYTQAQIDLYKNATDRVKYPNHNWLDDMFRSVVVQNHYLNLNGGKEGTTYSLGVGYTDQPGTMLGYDYKKYTLSLGLSSRINKRVTLGTSIQVRYGDKTAALNNSSTDLYISTLSQSPLFPARTPDGKWYAKAYQKELGNKNPVLTAGIPIKNPDYYGLGNVSLDIDLIKGLKWENRAGVTFDVTKSKVFVPTIPLYYYGDMSSAGNYNASLGLNTGERDNIYTTYYSQLNYKRSFGSHNLSILGGAQQEVNNYSEQYAYRTGYPTNSLEELNAGSPSGMTNSGTSSQWLIRSYYGSVNYDYEDKYLFGSSIRYDGTSRLPKDSRWGLFYAFSGAWRVSKEAFLSDVQWLNDLKLRGSWGKIGNQNIDIYAYQRVLQPNSYAFAGNVQPGAIASAAVDPSLTWETTRVFDLGADMTLLNNKLTVSLDWFNKYTYDILRNSQVPIWLGLQPPTINNGAVRNKGIELGMRYQDKIGKDFSWYVNGSFQTYRNKLVSFGKDEIGGPDGQTIMRNGQPINSLYLYVADGIFQNQNEIDKAPDQSSLGGEPTPGDIKYKDITGDGKVNADDRQVFSGQYPKFEYSLTMGANWKGFDASIQLYGSQGNKLYLYKWGVDPFAQGAPPTVDWRNRWTPDHPSTTMPKLYMGFYGYPKITNFQSTFHLYDASYIRIKNVQVGYTFSGRLLREVKNLRLYVSVDNLALFTPLKQGTDPERLDISSKPDAWYGFANYPQNRTFTFGASVQF